MATNRMVRWTAWLVPLMALTATAKAQPTALDPQATDLTIAAGESVTVHDAEGVATLRIDTSAVCSGYPALTVAGELTGSLDVDVLTISAGERTATARYEVRCAAKPGGKSGAEITKRGTIIVVRDRAADAVTVKDAGNVRLLRLNTSAPADRSAPEVTLTGDVAPGASVALDDRVVVRANRAKQQPLDIKHTPRGGTVALRVTHPRHGIHYYVRRGLREPRPFTAEDRMGCRDTGNARRCPPDVSADTAFVAACAAKNLSDARTYWWQLTDEARAKRLGDCERNHISKELLDVPAYLEISSNPPARVFIDGVDSKLTTPIVGRALTLAPGRHDVTFIVGDRRHKQSVLIRAGTVQKLHKILPP